MMEPVDLFDTGPLVSFLASGLEHHEWAVEQWKRMRPPLLTRYGSSIRFVGARSHSDRHRHSRTAGGPAGTHAALPQPADVTGGRLPGQAF